MPPGYSTVPPQLRLAFDETPLKYFAEQKGTYDHPKTQNVFMSCSREKRMVTGGPVTNELGEVVYFQIIWKGTSERCHPRFSDRMKALMHPAIHHDHAAKKTQTHETFTRLLKELDAELQAVKQSSSLPLDLPSIMLIDNVSSHINFEELKKVACHAHFNIYHVPGTHIYLLLGLPNRSHDVGHFFFHMFSSAHPHSVFFNTLVCHTVCFTGGSGVGIFTLPCNVVPQPFEGNFKNLCVPDSVYKELRKQGGGGVWAGLSIFQVTLAKNGPRFQKYGEFNKHSQLIRRGHSVAVHMEKKSAANGNSGAKSPPPDTCKTLLLTFGKVCQFSR